MSTQLLRLLIRESIGQLNEAEVPTSKIHSMLGEIIESKYTDVLTKYIPTGNQDVIEAVAVALSIMGRESIWGAALSVTGADRGYKHSTIVQNVGAEIARYARKYDKTKELDALGDFIGWKGGNFSKDLDASVGTGQMKLSNIEQGNLKDVASDIGVEDVIDINDDVKAVILTAVFINELYQKAKKLGYSTNSPGIGGYNAEKDRPRQFTSTGNAALDMAITGYNAGPDKVTKYCGVGEKVLKKPCPPGDDAGFVKDYIPFYGDKEINNMFYISGVAGYLTQIRPIVSRYLSRS